jgi:hypothetical protein
MKHESIPDFTDTEIALVRETARERSRTREAARPA